MFWFRFVSDKTCILENWYNSLCFSWLNSAWISKHAYQQKYLTWNIYLWANYYAYVSIPNVSEFMVMYLVMKKCEKKEHNFLFPLTLILRMYSIFISNENYCNKIYWYLHFRIFAVNLSKDGFQKTYIQKISSP